MDETTPIQPPRSRKWARIAIYMLAGVGLLCSVLIAVVLFRKEPKPTYTLDTDEAVAELMTRNYGKYSDAQRGWLYVNEENNATYVVTVVQQKKIEGKDGDELYLVASGSPVANGMGGTAFYGVFQLRWRDGQLYEYGDAHRPAGEEAVTPERVHFEALSADVWGWVVKTVSYETGDGDGISSTRNIVLAPRNERIAVLAEFDAVYEHLGAGDCDETERRYAAWMKAKSEPKAAAPSESAPAPVEGEGGEGEVYEPVRCTTLQWSYRTDPVADSSFTPLYITRKAGVKEGERLPAKTWKVMFDAKSFTYLLPDELKNQGV